MSTVYYCEGGIALKSMGEETNTDAVAIYKNDLQVLSDLGRHPYIVGLLDMTSEAMISHVSTGVSEAVYNCQVLEALHGGELFYHLVRHGPLSLETSRGFLQQLVVGVNHIHSQGYIHRDLKPWNLILSDDFSQIKIIDFGLATPLEPSQRQHPWSSFMPGTRQYMSPENIVRSSGERQAESLQTADLSKVDTFALGVILINMLTGNYLFESCLAADYFAIVSDSNRLSRELRQKMPHQIRDTELADLTKLL
mmetsp:Transcript_9713/g.13277  ORF Transcript_9713/g.13277 Transcript_9713/m.13277 type:complete len:252 (-) Transcript_9713:952-1707(-)